MADPGTPDWWLDRLYKRCATARRRSGVGRLVHRAPPGAAGLRGRRAAVPAAHGDRRPQHAAVVTDAPLPRMKISRLQGQRQGQRRRLGHLAGQQLRPRLRAGPPGEDGAVRGLRHGRPERRRPGPDARAPRAVHRRVRARLSRERDRGLKVWQDDTRPDARWCARSSTSATGDPLLRGADPRLLGRSASALAMQARRGSSRRPSRARTRSARSRSSRSRTGAGC
jgi:hypothetical protein